MTLVDPNAIRVDVTIDETDVAKVAVGKPALDHVRRRARAGVTRQGHLGRPKRNPVPGRRDLPRLDQR